MKIIVAQKEKKLEITFEDRKVRDKYTIGQAESFLAAIDKFLTKHHTKADNSFINVKLEFHSVGLLTERTVRAIIGGISFVPQ